MKPFGPYLKKKPFHPHQLIQSDPHDPQNLDPITRPKILFTVSTTAILKTNRPRPYTSLTLSCGGRLVVVEKSTHSTVAAVALGKLCRTRGNLRVGI